MTNYRFDDRNIKWNTLDGIDHLHYSVPNVDETNYIVHVLFKFDANRQIVLHHHLIPNNTFVVQGEFDMRGHDGVFYEVLDDNLNVIGTLGYSDFLGLYKAHQADAVR